MIEFRLRFNDLQQSSTLWSQLAHYIDKLNPAPAGGPKNALLLKTAFCVLERATPSPFLCGAI
jgi:hypothetical protein